MSRKILPTAAPPIISYLHHAYTLAITRAYPQSISHFYNNYISLRCYQEIAQYRNYDYFNFYNFHYYPGLVREQISRDLLSDYLNEHIVDFLIRAVDKNFYVLLYVDQYYISASRHYQTTHFTHDVFVHGYDNDERQLYLKGYLKNGSFSDYQVSYEDFTAAYANGNDYFWWQVYINLFQFDDGDYPFNVGYLKKQISDYLQAKNPQDDVLQFINPSGRFQQPTNFGVATYDSLQEYFQLMRDGEIGNDIRPLQVVWEHKKIMLDRLAYLHEQGYLPDLSLHNQYEEVKQKTEMARSLFLKYERRQDKSLIDMMAQFMDEVRQSEIAVLEKLLAELP
ncbi:hypothetical protein DUZ99_02500 [Xylanibacillus composti]|uniref:Butirosin biosynthesis protein H N-terminal domain-containing protein n=1 Tax=Xylanibacillus composti TaxID=1572762 RepID=A0A8J4M0R3_9BACL|nr:hypothetical protein [Xylanibacillus composti]MDT9723866.1 hypothetical protein [Xylanibacillus composti]GIQ67355.1 hypothetical protein XYCOK13_01790 [Xylanibacillus composti]